jgi:hypothetical protein
MNKEKILKQIFDRVGRLEIRVEKLEKTKGEAARFRRVKEIELNFDLSPRAFIKKYGKGLSYPKKFTLLVAYLCKGKISIDVFLKNVEKLWRRMTSKDLLKGKFNRSYTTKAKTQGWIKEGKKTGFYQLTSNWKEIFNQRKK